MARILTTCATPGPAEVLAPVVRDLGKKGHEIHLLGLGPKAGRFGGSLEIFRKLGIRCEDWTDQYEGDYGHVPESKAAELIASCNPDRIVVGTYRDIGGSLCTLDDALILAGRERGIPTVQFCDLWDSWNPKSTPLAPNKYCVGDDYTVRLMTHRGADPLLVKVTGHTSLEGFICSWNQQVPRKKSDYGLDGYRIVTYFGQVDPVNNPETLSWVVNALGPEDRLIFTPHPRDSRVYSSILARAAGKLLRLDWSSDQLLMVSDVVVTHYSTMGVKAALAGIQTINTMLDDDCRLVRSICGGYPVAVAGGSQEVHSEAEFRLALHNKRTNGTDHLKKVFNLDGNSVERATNEILCGF